MKFGWHDSKKYQHMVVLYFFGIPIWCVDGVDYIKWTRRD